MVSGDYSSLWHMGFLWWLVVSLVAEYRLKGLWAAVFVSYRLS